MSEQVDFASIQLTCAKPGCKNSRLQRHHKGHEFLWVAMWIKRRPSEPRYQKFCQRYWSFHEEDIVRVCRRHHAEIHFEYNLIIEELMQDLGPLLYKWSWPDAYRLMKKLRKQCDKWLKKETPGRDPSTVFFRGD